MSSAFASSPSPSIDPRRLQYPLPDPPQEEANYIHPAQKDLNTLSPYSVHQPYSTSVSPSDFDTPSDHGLYSEYVGYSGEDPNDPFYGVDFDPGAEVIEASPATLVDHPIATTDVPTIEAYLPESQNMKQPSSDFVPAYPVSPLNTSSASIRPTTESNENRMQMAQPQYNLSRGLSIPNNGMQYTTAASPSNLHPHSDPSGSSHNSAEGISPAVFVHNYSPRVTITPAGFNGEEHELPADAEHDSYMSGAAPYHGVQKNSSYGFKTEEEDASTAVSRMPEFISKEQPWDADEGSSRSGVIPERRSSLSAVEVPNFKDMEKNQEHEIKQQEVDEWMVKAVESVAIDDIDPRESKATLNAPNMGNRKRAKSASATFITPAPLGQNGEDPAFPEFRPTPQVSADPVEGKDIEPASDAMSIRENRLQEGQHYYDVRAKEINARDIDFVSRSRHFHDAPEFPTILKTQNLPQSSNEAMQRWNQTADTFSLLSRQATWGTRRRSEADMDSIKNGSFIKRLSFGREKKEKKQGSYFEKGLDQITNLVRKKSDSNQLKRTRSGKDSKENRGRAGAPANPRKESQASLAPPRSPSSNRMRPESPRLNTNVGGSPGALRRAHSGSISATSPNSNNKNGFGFVGLIRRARSRSDIRPGPGEGLADMWRGVGGPPLPTLASPPVENPDIKPTDLSDVEADDDEDDDGAEDGDRIDFDQTPTPITPTFLGFKDHVLRLNPHMEADYLVDRIAHQQVVRYKSLLNWRVKHSSAILNGSCTAAHHCMAQGGGPTLLDGKGEARKPSVGTGIQGPADFSDGDSNPEGQLATDSFPAGVPMPPATSLPAEFECQLCFRVKKFQKPSDWTKHVHEDVQPFTCTYSSCREPKSFKRKADWVRHENERHRHLEWWTCNVEDCTHKCYRKDNFLQHLVREHKLPEPKQKTKAAVKKARGSDEAVWVTVRNCHHETPARPQDEPCKFCGKVLTSWKKLTVHLAKHMEHISLPVLRLVEQQTVDANTIISPVEPLPPRASPLTPTNMGRELSGSFTMGSSISPNTAQISQFHSPIYHSHSPHGNTQPVFRDTVYSNPTIGFVANTTGPMNYGINAPVPQHQQPVELLYGNNQLGFNNFDQLNTGMHHGHNTAQSHGGYTPIDHSPMIDQNGGFATLNQGQNQDYSTSNSSQYNSYPNSNHTLSPDPSSFVPISGAQQRNVPGPYSVQSLTPDPVNFGSAPQQLQGQGFGNYDGLGLVEPSNPFGFQGMNGVGDGTGMDYSAQMPMSGTNNGNVNMMNGGGNRNGRNHSGSASFSSSPHGRNGSATDFGGRGSNAGQGGYGYH